MFNNITTKDLKQYSIFFKHLLDSLVNELKQKDKKIAQLEHTIKLYENQS